MQASDWHVTDPARLATVIRLRAVRMVAPLGFGYLGQALSSAEQVAALFTVMRPGRDRLVCSPGHYVIGIFAASAELGILSEDQAAGYGQDGSPVEAIGTERSPVADYVCGSLGQGLSAAAGFALSDRLKGIDRRTFAMVSDGNSDARAGPGRPRASTGGPGGAEAGAGGAQGYRHCNGGTDVAHLARRGPR